MVTCVFFPQDMSTFAFFSQKNPYTIFIGFFFVAIVQNSPKNKTLNATSFGS